MCLPKSDGQNEVIPVAKLQFCLLISFDFILDFIIFALMSLMNVDYALLDWWCNCCYRRFFLFVCLFFCFQFLQLISAHAWRSTGTIVETVVIVTTNPSAKPMDVVLLITWTDRKVYVFTLHVSWAQRCKVTLRTSPFQRERVREPYTVMVSAHVGTRAGTWCSNMQQCQNRMLFTLTGHGAGTIWSSFVPATCCTEFNSLNFEQHVVGTKCCWNSCCTSQKLSAHRRGRVAATCPRYKYLLLHVPATHPCYLSPQCEQHMILSLRHVAATCPTSCPHVGRRS